jgi:hypothetical protein
MFRVIEFFTDLQDGNHAYNVGDTFPREGVTVTADRIKELSGTQNKRGIALIEEVRGAEETVQDVPEDAAPVEDEPRKRGRKHKSE